MRRSAAVAVLAAGVLSSCSGRPPLHVDQKAGVVEVNVETLGEYPTTIRRLRLSEPSDRAVLWELVASEGAPQIHRIRLHVGPNDASFSDADGGKYSVVIPSSAPSFVLKADTTYMVEVWGTREDRGPSSATFRTAK